MRRGAFRRPFPLLQVVLELAAPRRMAQLAQRFRLDLPDALSRDVELAADLFERARAAVFETEAQLKHAPFATGEAFEHALDLLLEELVARGVARGEGLVVGDEVPEVAVLFLADRRLERDRFLRDLHDLADLVRGDEHSLGDLHGGRHATELLEQTARDADELVDGLDHVDRDADRPSLVRDRAGDRLANPPGRVRRELVSLPVVELLDRADESDVPFLDQVEEAHATSDVFLGDRHDETEVCLGQVVPRVVALLDELVGETAQRALLVVVLLHELVEVFDEDVTQLLAEHDQLAEPLRPFGRTVDLRVLREDPERESLRVATRGIDEPDGLLDEDLLLGCEERDLADLLEVHADRVVDADEVACEDRGDRVLTLQLLGLFLFFFDLRPRRRALGLEDLDVVVVKGREELLDFAGLRVGQSPNDVLLGDVALLATARDEALGSLAVLRMDAPLRCRGGRRRRFLVFGGRFHWSLCSTSAVCSTVCRSWRLMTSASWAARPAISPCVPVSASPARASCARVSSSRCRRFRSRSLSAAISMA